MPSGSSNSTSTGSYVGASVPAKRLVRLRAYLRHRERLVDYAASHIQHMQKALMQMNVQLHHAVADITGATGMRIIRAIVAGNYAPEQLNTRADVLATLFQSLDSRLIQSTAVANVLSMLLCPRPENRT